MKEKKLSRIEEWRKKKKEKNRQKNQNYNENSQEKRANYARERRRANKTVHIETRAAQAVKRSKHLKRRKENETALEAKKEKIRRQKRERVKRLREKRKQITTTGEVDDPVDDEAAGFRNRMAISRAVRRVKQTLPETPEKRAEIIQKISSSPRTRKHLVKAGAVKTPEEEKETKSLRAMAADIKEGLEEVKKSGSNEKRTALRAFKSLAFGQMSKNLALNVLCPK